MKTNYSSSEFPLYETPTSVLVNVTPESILCSSAGATNDSFEEVDWSII